MQHMNHLKMNSFGLAFLLGLAIGSCLIAKLDAINGCTVTQKVFSARRYSYDKIESFLEQANQDPEIQLKELKDWYKNKYIGKRTKGKREQRLRKTLGYLIDLVEIKSPNSCNASNHFLIRILIKDAQLDFTGTKKDAKIDKLIKHFIKIYDNDCTNLYSQEFEDAIKDLAPEDLAEVRKFGDFIANYRSEINLAARYMNQGFLYRYLIKMEETGVMDKYDSELELLNKACTAYVGSLERGFFQKVIDFSNSIRKDWYGRMTLPVGWINWDICDFYLAGVIRKTDPNEDEA